MALVSVPNVEIITATIFLSGCLLGSKRGALVGLLGEFFYSLLNPYGIAAPPLLLAQVSSMALVGFWGGVMGKSSIELNLKPLTFLKFGLSGLALTAIFDISTTLSFLIFAGFTFKKMIASFLFGLSFYIVHIAVNTILFASAVPLILAGVQRRGFYMKYL